MIAWILIGFLICLLAYLLLAPFSVRFDSREAAATLKLFHIGSGRLYFHNDSLWLELRVPGKRFAWDAIELAANMAARHARTSLVKDQNKDLVAQPDSKLRKHDKVPKKEISFQRVLAVIRSFRMPECMILIDTGSPARNGMLFTYAWYAHRWSGKMIGINFQGHNLFVVEVQNTLGRILWAFMRGK